MSENVVKLSTLRCEPYFADNSDCNVEEYGMRYPFEVVLWRVFVDEVCIAKEALPFKSLDAVIELTANKCVPVFSDGEDFIRVRSFEDKVLWFGLNFTIYDTFEGSPLPTDVTYKFDTKQYWLAIDQTYRQQAQNARTKQSVRKPLQKFLNTLRGTLATEQPKMQPIKHEIKPLPVLTTKDLKDILLHLLPYDFDLPLYRMPELVDDRRGERYFGRFGMPLACKKSEFLSHRQARLRCVSA